LRGGAGFDAVEGKTGSKGETKRLQLQLSERGNEKTQPAGWVFFGRTAKSSGYPARMWGSGRRAREVMPDACRAALLSCWKSVSFMAEYLCMRP